MLFYSTIFAFFFLPLTFLVYLFASLKYKNLILLLASFAFYYWGEPRFVWLALLSAIIDYFIGNLIYKSKQNIKAKYYLALGVSFNLIMLCYFKYVDFFLKNINQSLNLLHINQLQLLNIVLPVGVSFIVFEKITYLVDLYRKTSTPASSLKNYLLYVFFFPKLLAGPIIKYHDIAQQLTTNRFESNDFYYGFKRFLLGLIKKVLLADIVAGVSDKIFKLSPDTLGFNNAWLGIISFTLQVYLDFSAYSDMAIGLARMFGFHILENFNMPYTATSFTDFWHRWHISLSTWIKEYLYISLGGNRSGVAKTYFNLWVCFLISGLWHGANWTFIFFGAYHGLFLVMDKIFWLRVNKKLPKMLNISLTLFFIMLGLVIFRSDSLYQMKYFFGALFNPSHPGAYIYITKDAWTALIISSIISLIPASVIFNKLSDLWKQLQKSQLIENWTLSLFALLALTRVVTSSFNPFLYFKF